ncbi:effector binding domain-containing protein [Paenibacillus sp. GSMTC-2017]|uniref:GyrI-like domain-containing protein n=1 Tax=Paenibacillus sp. GSMTC-2017 TaxID=2794350 RepID=UPI0018D6636C|nr:effector binding domain-containing protein [Paenibacillus sp. GSMTC-2017]MBH5316742.1 effector binding domain-containing protein [Paenibacillus sp. GSMTC-2017]
MTTEQIETLERNETKLVGYTVTVSLNEDLEAGIVGKLREDLISKRHEIANRLEEDGIYLVQVYSEDEWSPDVPFVSIVAVEVSEFSIIPEGLVQHTIPAGKYVKVTHKGPESQIGDTYDSIREKDISSCRPFDFEYWATIDSLDQEENVIHIYLPFEA